MAQGRALITGASAGIGAALAEVCAEHGHDLILVARRRDRLDACAAGIENRLHVKVACVTEDLADPNGPGPVVDAVTAQGLEVEHLINNAGVGLYGKFSETE